MGRNVLASPTTWFCQSKSQWGFCSPRRNCLDNNTLVSIGLWVRKMRVGTKGVFGDYGFNIKLYQTGTIAVEI